VFGPTVVGGYWSASTLPFLASNAWNVGFANGFVLDDFKSNASHVRAVRGL
jgi:hypothetical protein